MGTSHSCARLTAGTVQCWGGNSSGQLGNGNTTLQKTPVAVKNLTGAVAIEAGNGDSCALLSGGTVKCWGKNSSGQLGNGNTTNSSTPVTVTGLSNVTAIATGAFHSCAVVSGGTVKCWGYNGFGQLGNGTTNNSSTPVAVIGITGAIAIAAGDNDSCAVLTNRTARCWGSNDSGQLGDGEFTTRFSATSVVVHNLSTATSIANGARHVCVLLADGTPRCWGDDALGQTGWDGGEPVANPTPINGGVSGVTELTTGGVHSCARLSNATVKCWGDNFYGQLGNGTTTFTALPAPVIGIHADTAAPTTTIVAPASNATLSGNSVVLDAVASDNIGVVSVVFHARDAAMHDTVVGSAASTIYGWVYVWDTTKVAPGSYTLTSVARDAAGNAATSAPVSVTVADTTPPSTAVIAPAKNATISGSTALDASASDIGGIATVDLHASGPGLDDVVVGTAQKTPYGWIFVWDSTSVANGSYSLTSVARDNAGNVGTSAGISVVVNNPV